MKVLVADDHELFADGIAALLRAWGHDVVGRAANGAEAVTLADRLAPDLLLMDVRMPVLSGVEATRLIKAHRADAAIVMLTVSEDEADLFDAIKAGARGYLLKDLSTADFRSMLESVGRGDAAITPATARRILAEYVGSEERRTSPDRLTDRELQVLRLITLGLRDKEIAGELGIRESTAKFHLKNILEKLHAESRTEAAIRALREGLVDARQAVR